MAKKKMVSLVMTVEATLAVRDIDDLSTLKSDLEGELVKIKSGAYENRFYGDITEVKIK